MKTITLKGVEIFAVGEWNGRDFTGDDIDAIVSAFETLGLEGRVPLKLGHEDTSQLALGWVTSLSRDGDTLVAVLEVTEETAELIKTGRLKFVSVELLKDVRAGTRTIPWVLDAVALLGTDQPAVGHLQGLDQHLPVRASAVFRHSAHATFTRTTNEEDEHMTEDTKALLAEVKALRTQLVTMTAETKAKEIKTHREALTARIERAIRAGECVPATREKFARIYKIDDDASVVAVTLDDCDSLIASNRAPGFKGTRGLSTGGNGDDTSNMAGDVAAVARINAWLEERHIDRPTSEDYITAARAVFRAHPEVAENYKREVLVQTGRTPK